MKGNRTKPIVTIDGPSGSGKSTLARLLADHLGFIYIDTGAMYRGIGWLVREKGIPFLEGRALETLLKNTELEFIEKHGKKHLMVNRMDVTDLIRTPEMGMVASKISAIGSVRTWLSSLQRRLGREGGAVLEGRDMGTVVFPDAEVKFFLTASLEERGRRRLGQLEEQGEIVDPEKITKEIALRDRNDSTRVLAPLLKADDAIEIDTTFMTIPEVVDRLLREIEEEEKGNNLLLALRVIS